MSWHEDGKAQAKDISASVRQTNLGEVIGGCVRADLAGELDGGGGASVAVWSGGRTRGRRRRTLGRRVGEASEGGAPCVGGGVGRRSAAARIPRRPSRVKPREARMSGAWARHCIGAGRAGGRRRWRRRRGGEDRGGFAPSGWVAWMEAGRGGAGGGVDDFLNIQRRCAGADEAGCFERGGFCTARIEEVTHPTWRFGCTCLHTRPAHPGMQQTTRE